MSPQTVNLIEAAALLGIGTSTAYAAAREGALPFPVLKIGGRYVVPTKPLAESLGITLEELHATITKEAPAA